MSERVLEGVRIAVLATDGFEQVELTRPVKALRKHGADVEIVSLHPGSILGMNLLFPGKTVDVDRTVFTAHADDYHGIHIPGGFANPDSLRQSERALDFVRAFEAAGKPIATICHGPWVLISADLVRGRRLASWPGIKDDVENAGAEWIDEKVVIDDNWVSSRSPADLPAFDKAIVRHFAAAVGREAPSFVRDMGWGGWLVGTAAAAAAGYVMRRTLRHAREGDEWDRIAEPAEFASTL
jgi:deglycase